MEFEYIVEDEIGIFKLAGNLIGENDGESLNNSFVDQLEEDQFNFIIDLTALDHINSSGLAALITLLTKCRKRGGDLVLLKPSEYIRNLMMITKLNSIFNIFESLEAAKTHFQTTD